MFSASTSSRFKENSTDAPGPGAYNTSNNWEDASGPGVLASKSDRFANRGALLNPPPRVAPLALTGRAYRYPESIAPGPGHYGGAPAVGPLATAGSVRAGGRRLSARPPAAPTDDTKLDRTLGDLKESLRVLRLDRLPLLTSHALPHLAQLDALQALSLLGSAIPAAQQEAALPLHRRALLASAKPRRRGTRRATRRALCSR